MTNYLFSSAALFGLALLLGACAYESVVMAPNFERDIPNSIDVARQFLRKRTPAHFFRVVAPVTALFLLTSVVVAWEMNVARWWLITSLVLLGATDVITFTLQYPRINILFVQPLTQSTELLQRAAREWSTSNWLRVLMLSASLLSALIAILQLK